MSTTTALLWIPPGICKEHPIKVEYTPEEYDRISQLTGLHLNESKLAYEKLKKEFENGQNEASMDEDNHTSASDHQEDDGDMESPGSAEKTKKKNKINKGKQMKKEDQASNDMDMDIDPPENDDDADKKLKDHLLNKEEKEEKEEKEKEEEGLEIYHFSDYDEDSDNAIQQVNIFTNLSSMVHTATPDGTDDPYVDLHSASDSENDEDEDVRIDPTDHLLCLATHQDGLSVLEFQVFTKDHTLYPHHDILLPTFPLCLARAPKHLGNWLAVGTMQPEIEIWDIDQLDPLVPVALLGGNPLATTQGSEASSTPAHHAKKNGTKHKKQKKPKSQSLPQNTNTTSYHTDSVLSLSWHEDHGILASGSADATVKLWDPMSGYALTRSFAMPSKVGSVTWTASPSVLLVGTLDAQCTLFDTRTPLQRHRWSLHSDPEHLVVQDQHAWVSLENGQVHLYDLRQLVSAPVWQLQAHTTACACVAPSAFGLATVGDDQVKVWNTHPTPALAHTRDLALGSLFSCAWCPGYPGFLAVGGEKGSIIVDFNSSSVIEINERDDEGVSDME